MPGDPFKRLSPGAVPTAEAWNAVLDVLRWAREQRDRAGASLPGAAKQSSVVRVRNNTGGDADRWAVLALGDPIILPDDNEAEFQSVLAFEGDAPDSTPAGRFVVMLEPVPDGGIGRGVLAGVVQCRLDASGGLEEFAECEDANTTSLVCSETGSARVLWAEDDGDERWAIVRLGDGAGTPGPAGSGEITVKELDDSPSYTGTSTVVVDQADGFVLTQPSANTVRIDIQAASDTQAGIVSTGNQTWTGIKKIIGDLFSGGLIIDTERPVQLGANCWAIDFGSVSDYTFTVAGRVAYGGTAGLHFYKDVAIGEAGGSLIIGDADEGNSRWTSHGSTAPFLFVFPDLPDDLVHEVQPDRLKLEAGSVYAIGADDGASATTGGLTFVGGIYTGGTLTVSIADNSITDAKLRDSAALSVIGRSANSTGDPADIAAGSDHQVLRRSGTSLAFGAVDLASGNAVTGDLPFANVAQLAGLSVAGVTGSSAADLAAITAGTDHHVLRRASSSSLAFGFADGRSINAFGCAVYRATSTQTFAQNAYTAINFDAEVYDDLHSLGSLHDNATNNSRITVPSGFDGYWLVAVSVFSGFSSGGSPIELGVAKNGGFTTFKTMLGAVLDGTFDIIPAVAGDYFQCIIKQTGLAGSPTLLSSSSLYPRMIAFYLGR